MVKKIIEVDIPDGWDGEGVVMKQTIEVEIPEGYEIDRGYEIDPVRQSPEYVDYRIYVKPIENESGEQCW